VSAVTGADGSYSMKLVPGHYQVKFEHPDYEAATVEVDIMYGQVTTGSVALKRKKGTLSGVVTDEETTQPIANVTVTATKT